MKAITRCLTVCCAAVAAVSTSAAPVSAWEQYRGSSTNNGVTAAVLPQSADTAALYWATKIGTDVWGADGPSPLTISGDTLYFSAGNTINKMDKNTGEVTATGEMVGYSSYALIAPLYSQEEDMIFVGLNNGTVEAFDAQTLKSLWVYTDELGGQTISPITYNDGCIYTGFWNSETSDASFVCIDVTDEDTSSDNEEKSAEWSYTSTGGFYWAGAYVNDSFAVVGTDDGAGYGENGTSKVVTFDKSTGEQLDVLEGISGDIRSGIVFFEDTGRYYFTSKGGLFCSVNIDENGKFSDLQTLDLGAATTCTPVLANGRAYVGISGSGWNRYNGSAIAVIDLETNTVAYTAQTAGTPQTSGLLSVSEDGYNYVYFVENTSPSVIRYVKDKQGVTEVLDASVEEGVVCAPALFTPVGEQDNYGMYNPVCDEDGTIYFKNDSSYIMAVGSTIETLKVECDEVLKEGTKLDKDTFTVTAVLANGTQKDVTEYVSVSADTVETDDIMFTVTYDYAMYNDGENGAGSEVAPVSADVDIVVLNTQDYESVESVITLIDEIGEVTADSGDTIAAAENAYAALDETLKQYVTNAEALTQARDDYDKLIAEQAESGNFENSSVSSQTEDSLEQSSSDSADDSSQTSETSSSADSSSKAASSASSANPSTGAAVGGLTMAALTLLGCLVIKKKS